MAADVTSRASTTALSAPCAGAVGGLRRRSHQLDRVRIRRAVDPDVGIRIAAAVARDARPRFDGRVVAAEPAEIDLGLRAAGPDLIRATLVVGAGDGDEPWMVRPARMIDLGPGEAGRLVERDRPAPVRFGIDHRHIAMRAIEVPDERHAGIAHRGPAAVAEEAQIAVRQRGHAGLRPGEETAGELAVRGDLEGVAAHRRLVPDDFTSGGLIHGEPRDQLEVAGRRVRVLRAQVEPVAAAPGFLPDRERRAVSELAQAGPIPAHDIDPDIGSAGLAPGEQHALSAADEQRFDVAAALGEDGRRSRPSSVSKAISVRLLPEAVGSLPSPWTQTTRVRPPVSARTSPPGAAGRCRRGGGWRDGVGAGAGAGGVRRRPRCWPPPEATGVSTPPHRRRQPSGEGPPPGEMRTEAATWDHGHNPMTRPGAAAVLSSAC